MTTTFINRPMAWTNQRLKFTQNDCINLKTLWKMLILEDNHEKEDINSNNVSLIFSFYFSSKKLSISLRSIK